MRYTDTKDPEYMEDLERRSNRYSANALSGIVGVLFIVFILNLVGVFEISQKVVSISFAATALIFIAMQIIVRRDSYLADRSCKYVLMLFTLLLTGLLTVLLNIHATLALLIPMLMSTQYRSKRLANVSIACSGIIGLLSPVAAFYLRTWDFNYLSGYLETACGMRVVLTVPSNFSAAENVGRILLYLGLPQLLILCAFGIFIISIIYNRIEAANTAMQAKELNDDLIKEQDTVNSFRMRALDSMTDILENRDLSTGEHVKRTCTVIRMLTDEMLRDPQCGITEKFASDLVMAASLHDIGKIAIDDYILKKPGRLTKKEYDIIRTHPERSASIIEKALGGLTDGEFLSIAVNTARYHHERYDGSGYPCGLRGKDIPLEARIMAVADVYDALISERSYKKAMPLREVYEEMIRGIGTQFDPDLVKYFVSARQRLEEFYMSQNNTDEKEQTV